MDSSDVTGYKLIIETEGEVRLSYQDLLPAQNIKTFSDAVQHVIEANYFPECTPNTTHIQVKFTKGVPAGLDQIEDDKLSIRGKVRDGTLDMTFRRPDQLEKGLRKYFKSST